MTNKSPHFVGRLQEVRLFPISWLILTGFSSVCVNWLHVKSKLPILQTKICLKPRQAKTYLTKIFIPYSTHTVKVCYLSGILAMSHSRFRFLCRWWYHDQIGRNHDCRWSDRLNDKHDHFLRRDHLSGYRTQKGNTLHKEKNHTSAFSMSFCCCRCYCWYCCCVIFDSLRDRSPNGRGGVGGKGEREKGEI